MAHLKVSSRSNPNAVAGAFAGVVREQGRVAVQVVGAGALNQAIKAVAIARSMLAAQGIDLVCVPSFAEIEIDGQPRTAMQLVVERREPAAPATGTKKLADGHEVPDLRIETSVGDITVDSDAVAPLVTKPLL
jgi:stage V sporulation protein S